MARTARDPHDTRRPPAAGIPKPEEQATVSVAEAARILDVHPNTAYKHIRSGAIPSRRVGRRIVVSVQGLRAFLGMS